MSGPGPVVRTCTGHVAQPVKGSVYSEGPRNAGRVGDVRRADHYPLTALCKCGGRIRCVSIDAAGWAHTGTIVGR